MPLLLRDKSDFNTRKPSSTILIYQVKVGPFIARNCWFFAKQPAETEQSGNDCGLCMRQAVGCDAITFKELQTLTSTLPCQSDLNWLTVDDCLLNTSPPPNGAQITGHKMNIQECYDIWSDIPCSWFYWTMRRGQTFTNQLGAFIVDVSLSTS